MFALDPSSILLPALHRQVSAEMLTFNVEASCKKGDSDATAMRRKNWEGAKIPRCIQPVRD
jgi:hypothetical protein